MSGRAGFWSLVLALVGSAPRVHAARGVHIPANAAPVISTTSQVPDYQAAEVRLAEFIKAIQQNRRQRAVRFLSSRVTAPERRALLEGRWLRRAPSGSRRADFTQILFLPDLQIRTRRIYRDTLRVAVLPRLFVTKDQKGAKDRPIGYLEVRMRREHGRWWVEMHPERVMSNAR